MNTENMSKLNVHELRKILSHPSLRIESEDSLYNFIRCMIEKDRSYSELLEFVVFKFLSPKCIKCVIHL